ncbi:C6 transcription factor [Emericellopsis cladophorae]|uniref:C6 transcription factor n=1 Tax=Emericellopsis cladophorae TaxID=2686198 RepID=A0A9P9Y7S5_9HYPO|nr:C6 transcription factor [Emericellopsis cladophorae]KAI6784560.1 C6 transcription factor [Emericellopsis cladophorae]
MRRMLHHCNTAIRRTPRGEIVYAPHIALELELQLDEWYGYFPEPVRFQHLDADTSDSAFGYLSVEPLGNFLRAQYYCCKLSIYWPAVYQSIQDNTATPEVLKDCQGFFDAYIQVMPNIRICIRNCIVNRWTLYAIIFIISMAF